MNGEDVYNFFDKDDLLERLTGGVEAGKKEVVFVVGSPLTASLNEETPGVASVKKVVDLVKKQFATSEGQLKKLDSRLESADNSYQAAFLFLQGTRGQDAINSVIRNAVLMARFDNEKAQGLLAKENLSEEILSQFDNDVSGWSLTPGIEALAELIVKFPKVFGHSIITSNFDPLIEIAIRRFGGSSWRTSLHTDGSLDQSVASGTQIVHIHGFWHGTDTLHTGNQLVQKRPGLKNSLLNYLSGKTVVVIAYGGWRDVFTEALSDSLSNSTTYPDVLWAFFDSKPSINSYVSQVLRPGLDRNRVTLYAGVDCNYFFPELLLAWSAKQNLARADPEIQINDSQSVQVLTEFEDDVLSSADSDRPPYIDLWVGRGDELKVVRSVTANLVILNGLGGQGKSFLAAEYLREVEKGETPYKNWDWRDCKEEGDKIRTQIISILERFSPTDSAISFGSASDNDLVELFCKLCGRKRIVFVLDNVDHYVELEDNKFVGILDEIVNKICRAPITSKVIITCRPKIQYDSPAVVSLNLGGLTFEDTKKVFEKRVKNIKYDDIDLRPVFELTQGHPFWLNLIAAQEARSSNSKLRQLLDDIRRGRGDNIDVLSSIWLRLGEREKLVLRTMAEMLRPETNETIYRTLSGKLNFNRFDKALRALNALNLIVLKAERNAPDMFDLHPLVKRFIRNHFEPLERIGFIEVVLKAYSNIVISIGTALGINSPFAMLERLSYKAELEIEAKQFVNAFETMDKCADMLVGAGHYQEFIRVGRKLLQAIDWTSFSGSEPRLDKLIHNLVICFDAIEDYQESDDLLCKYESTIPSKTARYINLCNIRCHSFWTRGAFEDAVDWGSKGKSLKESTNVDTDYDSEYNLALAQRDGGKPELALERFLNGSELRPVLEGKVDAKKSDGPFFGNIGRCLQLSGNPAQALVCYKRSAQSLEITDDTFSKSNKAFARMWIGECLEGEGKDELALCFFTDAHDIWLDIAPGRAKSLVPTLQRIAEKLGNYHLRRAEAQRRVLAWISD